MWRIYIVLDRIHPKSAIVEEEILLREMHTVIPQIPVDFPPADKL